MAVVAHSLLLGALCGFRGGTSRVRTSGKSILGGIYLSRPVSSRERCRGRQCLPRGPFACAKGHHPMPRNLVEREDSPVSLLWLEQENIHSQLSSWAGGSTHVRTAAR